MNWQLASKRALEMAAWSFAPVAALGTHHAVRLKFEFLQQHHFIIANVNDRTLSDENLWKFMEPRYGFLCLAAVLIPATCCFIQHLSLRWWQRSLIGITICAPLLWYTSVALYLFGKVITQAP
jgi:hypothetical protein